MASSPLDNLAGIGQLKIEPPAQAEIDGLVRSGLARLRDAENASLSIESRFDLAYKCVPRTTYTSCNGSSSFLSIPVKSARIRTAGYSYRNNSPACVLNTTEQEGFMPQNHRFETWKLNYS